MKPAFKSVLAMAFMFLAPIVGAAGKTVTLSVPSMDCAVCPITVKKALAKVPGVLAVEVSFEKRQAVVNFDDAKADLAALTRATADAGYPSTLGGGDKR